MIDLDRAAQAAEEMGWMVAWRYEEHRVAVYQTLRGWNIKLRNDGSIVVDGEYPLTDIAPLIAAWAALVQTEARDGDGA